jgi:ATP-dependent DNA helicase RecG
MRSAQDLLDELNASDESPRIEAKRAREMGKSLLETVIAFANEPGMGGGCLLLGVDWSINDKGDTVYHPEGVPDPDKLQRDLATQCASMLSFPLRPEISVERIDGKTLIVVHVAEVDSGHKPVYLSATGLPRGAFRRIGSTDQRCTDEDLWVLRGDTRPQKGPDQSLLTDARLDDFDPAALAEYRRVRSRLNPSAEELSYSDGDLLEALGAVRRVDGQLRPTLAGILLFGKQMALRRLLPMVKIDYIRVPGVEWMDNPHERFQSIEIRKPLLLALPLAEASIIDELPKGFHLPEGELHSVQEPIVPRKVIREALANAVMHRSYSLHSPIQIIRYSNRIEIRNVGHSLKPVAELGIPGSRLRNPTLAAVLHDLNLAEAKGTGIRSMRRLAAEAGLTLPEFHSSRESDEFRVTLFLHNLLTEDDHAWLRSLTSEALDSDEVKVLIYARATGAVDNMACRDFSGLDTLTASRVLRRLRDRGLLAKRGSGNATYYTLNTTAIASPQTALPGMEDTKQGSEPSMSSLEGCKPSLEGFSGNAWRAPE